MGRDYGSYTAWWQLFDALCLEQGHVDNGALASAYCALTKKKTDGAYDSALKSLNNWRRGVHVPNRRNFRLLTLILALEDQDMALPHWLRLYEEAQCRKSALDGDGDEPAESTPTPKPRYRRVAAFAAVALLIAGGGTLGLDGWPWAQTEAVAHKTPEPGPKVIDMTGERIYWRELSELALGDSVVIHGKRGRCGEQPTTWEETFAYLPELSTGIWSDGGVGYRISRSCGGATPARAVVFTATQPGEDRFMLYEDPITIRVGE